MNNAAKLGAGVAGGYLLGRTKKLKLAIGLGAWLMGKRLQMSPGQLAMQGLGQLRQSPEFAEITDRLRNEVGGAGRKALSAAATSRMETLADRLRDRNEGIDDSDEDEDYDDQDDAYDDDEDDDAPRDEDDDAPRDEDEDDEDDGDDDADEDEDDDAPRDEDEDYDDEEESDVEYDLPGVSDDDYDDEDLAEDAEVEARDQVDT